MRRGICCLVRVKRKRKDGKFECDAIQCDRLKGHRASNAPWLGLTGVGQLHAIFLGDIA